MAKVNMVRDVAANEREINAVLREMNGKGFELMQVIERGTLDMMGNKGVFMFFQAVQRAGATPVGPPPGGVPFPHEPYPAPPP